MKIQQQDIYYGAVLNQLAQYPVLTSINKIGEKAGLYLVNESDKMLIKYSRESGPVWQFGFSYDDLEQLSAWDVVALNCGNDSICMLHVEELHKVINRDATHSQVLKVFYNAGESIRVSGPTADLPYTIPHNAFPGKLLGTMTPQEEEYAWPELVRLRFYRADGTLLGESVDRKLDLSDTLGDLVDDGPVTLYIGVTSYSHKWFWWDEKNIGHIENQIKYDFGFDGYKVKLRRHTSPNINARSKVRRQCSTEFRWEVKLSVA